MMGGWRLAVVGITFAALFGILGLRLWTVQVTASEDYIEQAEQNQVRLVATPAPRGNIYDANGVLLAGTRPSLAAVADLALIDEATRESLARTMGAFLGVPASEIIARFDAAPPGSQLTLASDLTELQALTLFERREDFPGVAIIPQPVRAYDEGNLAAHVLGYIGKPSREVLDERPAVSPNDVVGKAGVERVYDSILRGTEGTIKYRVDARRNVLAMQGQQDPEPGSNIVLTIDAEVQRQLQESLAEGLALARRNEMEERAEALAAEPIPIRIREAFEEARADQASSVDVASDEGVDDTDLASLEAPTGEPIAVDEGAVLGPLYPGLPIDGAGVCIPVERIDLDLDPETSTSDVGTLSGSLRRSASLDAVLGEEVEQLVAVVTVAGETYRLGVNDGAATTVTVVAITQATESSGPSVVLHHVDKYCPVRSVGVVLDPNTGAVIAMAAHPTFEPRAFVGGLSHEEWSRLGTVNAFTNFAVQGQYAPASTMKSVAFVMAMEEGVFPYDRSAGDTESLGQVADDDETEPVPLASDQDEYLCSGFFEFDLTDGSTQKMFDWRAGGHGPLTLHEALRNSCDLYFWDLAFRIWQERGDESGINDENLWQEWARRFGFDEQTGVDLPFERSGLIPDRDWFRREQEAGSPRVRSPESGGWVGGDLMNAIVGEGAVLTTPLQLANAYAAMINGGTVYQPYVVAQVTDQDGDVIKETAPTVLKEVELSSRTVAALRANLAQVVNHPEGTADRAFGDFGPGVTAVGGKTGTGEVIKAEEDVFEVDNAWFVGIGPVWSPRYVVATVVERGGSGGAIAAPITKQILQYLLLGEESVTPQKKGANVD